MPALDRFVEAQRSVYAQALAELLGGLKTGHWMWFVFPQIDGLGRSETARAFSIRDLAEARAYLAHGVLGPRLREATAVTLAWAGKRTRAQIFGTVDALKFVSCMTLFEAADEDRPTEFTRALDGFAGGERDSRTLTLLRLPG